MSDCVIKISNDGRFRETEWSMSINLEELAGSAGKRRDDLYEGGSVVDLPMARAKKLLKLIWEYGTKEDFVKCDKYLAKNKKLFAHWRKIREADT